MRIPVESHQNEEFMGIPSRKELLGSPWELKGKPIRMKNHTKGNCKNSKGIPWDIRMKNPLEFQWHGITSRKDIVGIAVEFQGHPIRTERIIRKDIVGIPRDIQSE